VKSGWVDRLPIGQIVDGVELDPGCPELGGQALSEAALACSRIPDNRGPLHVGHFDRKAQHARRETRFAVAEGSRQDRDPWQVRTAMTILEF
jgi:hypothetical protein